MATGKKNITLLIVFLNLLFLFPLTIYSTDNYQSPDEILKKISIGNNISVIKKYFGSKIEKYRSGDSKQDTKEYLGISKTKEAWFYYSVMDKTGILFGIKNNRIVSINILQEFGSRVWRSYWRTLKEYLDDPNPEEDCGWDDQLNVPVDCNLKKNKK